MTVPRCLRPGAARGGMGGLPQLCLVQSTPTWVPEGRALSSRPLRATPAALQPPSWAQPFLGLHWPPLLPPHPPPPSPPWAFLCGESVRGAPMLELVAQEWEGCAWGGSSLSMPRPGKASLPQHVNMDLCLRTGGGRLWP